MAIKTPAPERQAGRRRLAKQGNALPDGSFPIPNVAYLKKAIRAVGRAAAGKRPALARLIRKRARQLGSAGQSVLKGSWADSSQGAKAMANALQAQLIELGFTPQQAAVELAATMPLLIKDLAGPRPALQLAGKATPNKDSWTAGKKGGKWDPDHDGDDDSSPSGDTDNDYAGKLNPTQRAVFKRCLARGDTPSQAYKIACNSGGGMKKAA